MALWVIELNDTNICVSRDGKVVDTSPGIAVVNRRQVLTGLEAAAEQQLNPCAVYNRYWQQLSEAPLLGATRQVRHHADLAYHHLAAIIARCGQPDEAIFAVPAHYGEPQLALLLGICSALKLKVGGLVDSNVAAVAASCASGRYTLAEIYQHHVTLVELEVDDTVTRRRVTIIDQSGLGRIEQACIDLISDAFLEQSRFDPLHEAGTEQLLYTNLPAWMKQAGSGAELDIAIDYHGSRFAARIDSREFERVTAMVLAPVAERLDQGTTALLSPALAALPGSQGHFANALLIPADAGASGIAEHRLAIGGSSETVAFVTQLPATANPRLRAVTPRRVNAPDAYTATHILYRGHATPLDRRPLSLGTGDEPGRSKSNGVPAAVSIENGEVVLQANGLEVEVNGARIAERCRLQPGDHIVVERGAAGFTAISVSDRSAS